ncbi:VOC family protein [Kribbella sandramycini]|uniref:VOC family protein n=1 Tax=Kribbella sandramycini TaxID=60450 RepID=A0A7Y4P2U2_9ACTN|nr:VOC family protein [Kribbella sandramycini]MBB6571148.1 hypothetical protein [Kribbella sandramycini]NOL43444.1 VOC family protein [Kribbella sandramycini]
MSITLENITFDCADAATLAAFWAGVLATEVDPDASPFFATVNRTADTPTFMFLQVPEPRTTKNRLHVDLATPNWPAEVDRLISLGAKRHDEHNEYGTHWITLADPEGNLFDLAEVHA